MRIWALLALLGLHGLFLAVPAHAAKLRVVTTLPWIADLVTQIAGDDVEVTSLVAAGVSAHEATPRPEPLRALKDADILIRVGRGLEDSWLSLALSRVANERIQRGRRGDLSLAAAQRLLDSGKVQAPPGTSSPSLAVRVADNHGEGDPHWLLDPRAGIDAAGAIEARLEEHDPARTYQYKRALDRFVKGWWGRIALWNRKLREMPVTSIVSYHATWKSFAAWAGWAELAIIESQPGLPPTPGHLADVAREAQLKRPRFVVIEPYEPRGAADHVAQVSGARVLVVSSNAATYAAIFDGMFKAIETRPAPPKPKATPSASPSPSPSEWSMTTGVSPTPDASGSASPNASPSPSETPSASPRASTSAPNEAVRQSTVLPTPSPSPTPTS